MPLQGLLMADDRENEAGEEDLGLLVPVRVLDLGRWVGDEGVGQGSDMLVQIEAVRGQRCQRVVGGTGPAGEGEGIEDEEAVQPAARLPGDAGVLRPCDRRR